MIMEKAKVTLAYNRDWGAGSSQSGQPKSTDASFRNGDGNGGGGDMLEPRIARLESDVSYIRRDIDELKGDVKSVSQSMIIVLERLETIKESMNKKPSTDTVDKKISEAKLAVLLGVPAIIAVGTGIYKIIQHYL